MNAFVVIYILYNSPLTGNFYLKLKGKIESSLSFSEISFPHGKSLSLSIFHEAIN